MSYDLGMKMLSTWFLLLLLAGGVPAQLQVVPEHRPLAVFGGIDQNIAVQLRNIGGQAVESELRLVLLQTSTATAARSSEVPWKRLLVLPGQTVLEAAAVTFPAVRAETRFLVQWVAGPSNIVGRTEVLVYPTNLLAQLKAFAGDTPIGVFDPMNELKPLLRAVAVEFQNLQDTGTDKFLGRLAIFGPFPSATLNGNEPVGPIERLARKGTGIVWLQPPPEPRSKLQPSFYSVPFGSNAAIIVQPKVVQNLATEPQSQLNLIQLCGLALQPEAPQFPKLASHP
jgi:hypothetical protein